MRWLIVILLIGGVYAYILAQPKTVYFVSPAPLQDGSGVSVAVSQKVDTRVGVLRKFFEEYNSPLVGFEKKFIETSDRYGFDWRLLPSIAGVESSLGRHACGYNIFGWGSCSISFSSYEEAIETVGRKIATLSYYAWYRKSGSLWDFATAYNFPYREKYHGEIQFFYQKISDLERRGK